MTKIGPEGARLIGAAIRYRTNPVTTAQRFWQLYQYRKFSPDEIHFLRLLDPALSAHELAQVVSKEELLTVQRQLNPRHLHALTEDKMRFYAHCLASRLPVPAVYALYDRDDASAHGGLLHLRDVPALEVFLQNPPAGTFIVKPVEGVHGEGVMRLRREGSVWRDSLGEVVTARSLITLFDESAYGAWMVQQRVSGHPDLCALSGTDALQTVRVVTTVGRAGEIEILAARLRLICGRGAHDNFDYGRTGNMIANLDLGSGAVRSVVGGARERLEIRTLTHHPVTGRGLVDYRVPQWEAVRDLVRNAASAFLPLRTLGWDVAITPDKPCLIEANVTWDTLSGETRMGEIYRYLQDLSGASPTADPRIP